MILFGVIIWLIADELESCFSSPVVIYYYLLDIAFADFSCPPRPSLFPESKVSLVGDLSVIPPFCRNQESVTRTEIEEKQT